MDKLFLSCDWGTSSFRLRLIDSVFSKQTGESCSNEGVATIYNQWLQKNNAEEERLAFYQTVLKKHISNIEDQLKISLERMPVVVSGMASSSIGMKELPYKQLPVTVNIRDLHFEKLGATENFKHDMIIVSGIRTDTDIMRGEEVQLMGCLIEKDQKQLFVFPGTHSKHVIVENGQITSFQTYMTGEFFNLLSVNSILSKSISIENVTGEEFNRPAFEKGVSDSLHTSLLHQSFMVRTNDLFQRFTKKENYWYLSGLLIGTELKDLFETNSEVITIVSEGKFASLYETACNILNKGKNVLSADVNNALIKAHTLFAKQIQWK